MYIMKRFTLMKIFILWTIVLKYLFLNMVVDSCDDFYSGADSKLVQGLMGILTLAIQGIQAENALLLTPEFATEMGVLNSLSPSRSNGFRNMFDKVMNEIREQI